MAKLDRSNIVARRILQEGYSLVAYVLPGEDRAKFRVEHQNDDHLSRTVSADDAVALCAILTHPRQ